MHSFDQNSVGYHRTGGRFDYYCLAGFAVVVDTVNGALNVISDDWISIEEAKQTADALNAKHCN